MGGLLNKMSHLSLDSPVKREKCDIQNRTSDLRSPEELLITPKQKFIADHLLDPRSASAGIQRTPLILVQMEKNMGTPVKAEPYLETDLDAEDLNIVQTDTMTFSESEMSTDISIGDDSVFTKEDLAEAEKQVHDNIETDLENPMGGVEKNLASSNPIEDQAPSDLENFDRILSEEDIFGSPLPEKFKKNLIYDDNTSTPESTPVKLKCGRTPLGLVGANSSPLPSPLTKQWRGIRDERVRLGLENTPPPASEHFPDVAQSAPGKFGARGLAKKARSKAHWALDDSIVI